jgi:hypothetical protein
MFLSHYWKSSVGGVARFFASVSVVGEANAIAVRSVELPAGGKPSEKPRGDIVGRKEGRRRIGKRRSVVVWD